MAKTTLLSLPVEIVSEKIVREHLLPEPPKLGHTSPVIRYKNWATNNGHVLLDIQDLGSDRLDKAIFGSEYMADMKTLKSLCLTSRDMYKLAIPTLYRNVVVWSKYSAMLLLRTLLETDGLALLIYSLALFRDDSDSEEDDNRNLMRHVWKDMSPLQYLKEAPVGLEGGVALSKADIVRFAKLDDISDPNRMMSKRFSESHNCDWFDETEERHVAAILCLAQGIRELYLFVPLRGLPAWNCVEDVLLTVHRRRGFQALPSVKSFTFSSVLCCRQGETGLPFWRLPGFYENLEALDVLGDHIQKDADLEVPKEIERRELSRLRELRLVSSISQIEDMTLLASRAKGLRRLEMWNRAEYSNPETIQLLSSAIQPSSETLELLSVWGLRYAYGETEADDITIDVSNLHSLKTLRIDIQALLGSSQVLTMCPPKDGAELGIMRLLPPSLTELHLYFLYTAWIDVDGEYRPLPEEYCSAVRVYVLDDLLQHRLPNLKKIRLHIDELRHYHYAHRVQKPSVLIPLFEEAIPKFRKAGIDCSYFRFSHLPNHILDL